MSQPLFFVDAHCHLGKDPNCLVTAPAVINSANSGDWEAIFQFCSHHSKVIPGFGIHPWETDTSSKQTVLRLEREVLNWIDAMPNRTHCVIGEIGLHKSPEKPPLERQHFFLEAQLVLAQKYFLVPCIHCVKAWQPLQEALLKHPPPRGFLIHDYSGSIESLKRFLSNGAYVSFSEKSFTRNPQKKISLIQKIPTNRYLLESDQEYPSNLQAYYQTVARKLNTSPQKLVKQMNENFINLFSSTK